ncbi:MAG: hypothetical protein GX111_06425 [Clostridiales bacterium]|jgi:hypothetical protein|nr:hypothetical protein [Clostridiales bacterium]
MKDFKIIFKIIAAVIVVSTAVCTIVIFRKELTELLSGVKQKLESKKNCCSDFADFDDV